MKLKEWIKKNNVPSINILIKKTNKYIKNKNWYRDSNNLIQAYYKSKTNLFIDILAMSSPCNTVKQNTYQAISTINNLDKVDSISYGITTNRIRNRIKNYVKTKEFSGDKINQFADSLKLINGSVCIDVWMLKAFNIDRRIPTYNDKIHITTIIKKIADKLNLKTYEVQACLWVYAKKELNSTSFKESYDFTHYLKYYLNQTKIDGYMR